MGCSDYIRTVQDQIRNNKAKNLIEDELRDHMEEQKQTYVKQGFSNQEAEEKTILDMGDPVEVGMELNRVHRPRLEKKLFSFILAFGVLGLLIQCSIDYMYGGFTEPRHFITLAVYTLIGCLVMVVVYYFDYTILGKYPLLLWSSLYLIGILYLKYGRWHYTMLPSMLQLLYLFVPIFAGVLFKFRTWKLKGLVLSSIIGMTPLILAIKGRSYSGAIYYLIIIIVMISLAVVKRWFGISRKLGFVTLLGVIFGCSLLTGILHHFFAITIITGYQDVQLATMRIGHSNQDIMYLPNLIQHMNSNAKLFGNSSFTLSTIPVLGSNYVLVFVSSLFGRMIALLLITILFVFIYKAYQMARIQKSHLGYLVAMACSISFFVQFLFYYAANLGFYRIIMLFSQITLPFLSSGLRNTVYSYLIAGLLLSVYRNTNLVSDRMIKQKKRRFIVSKSE